MDENEVINVVKKNPSHAASFCAMCFLWFCANQLVSLL